MTAPRPELVAELLTVEHDRYRRLELETIPAGLRHLSPLYRPDLADEVPTPEEVLP